MEPVMIRFQPSPHTDHVTDDGTELTKLPYPVLAHPTGLACLGSKEVLIVGFVGDPNRQDVDLWWNDITDLQATVGMYMIINDDVRCPETGHWSTLISAIQSVTEVQS
jgi:hypothetical protein